MTEITFNRKSLLGTLDAFQTQFELANTMVLLETDPSGEKFVMTAARKDAPEVKAFGPCSVNGQPLKLDFDLVELRKAVEQTPATTELTLVAGDGLRVKNSAAAAASIKLN